MNVETMMNVQADFIRNSVKEGKRLDGRKPDEFRKIEIEKNLIPNAEGSCRVRMGNTHVIAGIKMGVAKPFSDKPDDGILISNAELAPMAAARFEPGRPSEDAVETARVIDRGIRESKSIETDKLCIEKGEKVWMVNVDVQVMNHDGNLIDAGGLAAAIALANCKIPKYDPETDTVDISERKEKLPFKLKPIPVTIFKIGGKLVLDPTLEEEDVADARLTVSTMDNGHVTALQKSGSGSFSTGEIEEAIAMSVKKGKELRKLVE